MTRPRKHTSLWGSVATVVATALLVVAAVTIEPSAVQAQAAPSTDQTDTSKPNILVIFGDDIGITNLSAYSQGVVGYRTPNIDRIASEGMMFTDYYGENSCTAGRASFIIGQTSWRTGLSKVGAPGAPQGIQPGDLTIAQALKAHGYATGQFGKNHLGDRDAMLPTNHGFDEFFGNLYHLNAEEEPERPYWNANDPFFKNVYKVRGVIHSWADGKIEDTGPLNSKRMETIDDETTGAAIDFMGRQVKANKPFFVWMNTTRMHMFTHVRPSMYGQSGLPGNHYADGMIEHDQDVGKLLKSLDDLGISKNTIVVYTTDNGPNMFSWPDAATSPFRSEKDSNWEGAFRVPGMVRWPGHIQPHTVSNVMFSNLDWFPTLLAAVGEPDITQKLLKGTSIGGKNFKVHLDGFNYLPYLTGKTNQPARHEFFYFDDDAQLVAMRMDNWKFVYCEQRAPGQLNIWAEPFTCLRLPKMFNLRMDPFEHADISGMGYDDWRAKNVYLVAEGTYKTAQFLQTFVDYPPNQAPASFSVDQIVKDVKAKIQQQQKTN